MDPHNIEWSDTLKKWGLTPENYVLKALPRNLGVLSRNDQARLARRRVAIAGMGGVGGLHLITLARAGVGAFHISDFDRFEPANFNRQYGARIPTLGRPKTDVLRADALAVNPFLDIRSFDRGINAENVDAFLDGVDLFLDGLDFFVPEVRRLVYGRAREKGIPVVTAGPIGFGTVALVFDPRGMSFDEYFDMHDGMDPFEQMLRFYVGLLSKNWLHAYAVRRFGVDLANKSGPSTPMGCLLASALAATEIVRILTGRPGLKPAPWCLQFDPYVRGMILRRLRWGNRGPLQRLKLWVARKKLRGAKPLFRSAPAAPAWNGEGAVPPPVMEHILNAGLQAPSGDNIQPWAMSVREGGVEIAVKQNSDPSFFNFEERAALISLGAVSENIRVAASVYGLATRLEPPVDVSRPARIFFEQRRVAEDPLASILWERETNRRPHGKTPLDPEDLSAMVDAAAARGARLRWSVERKEIATLADMAYWADRARVLLRECHETLYKAFRSNIDDARRSGDGFFLREFARALGSKTVFESHATVVGHARVERPRRRECCGERLAGFHGRLRGGGPLDGSGRNGGFGVSRGGGFRTGVVDGGSFGAGLPTHGQLAVLLGPVEILGGRGVSAGGPGARGAGHGKVTRGFSRGGF
jgi:molybdopterin/thiamine biosynthesis adenylyltransferase